MFQQSLPAEIIRHWASLASEPELFHRAADDQALLLFLWARLGHRVGELAPHVSWKPCERLTESALRYAEAKLEDVRHLLRKSNSILSPLTDPLSVELGLNRWLAGDREEAYSDWLAWVLTNFGHPELVGKLLYGDAIPPALLDCKTHCLCEREVWVPQGHVGQAGYLDLVLRFGLEALIVIEVKVEGADSADTVKQEGYGAWLKEKEQQASFKDAILLAIAGKSHEYNGFRLLCWKDFCCRLRQCLPRVMTELNLTTAALAAAFVGAVEQNLLRLPSLTNVEQPGSTTSYLGRIDEVTSYLRNSLSYLGGCNDKPGSQG